MPFCNTAKGFCKVAEAFGCVSERRIKRDFAAEFAVKSANQPDEMPCEQLFALIRSSIS